MVRRESKAENLQKRIAELERQLADAQVTIGALQAQKSQNDYFGGPLSATDRLPFGEDGYKQALLTAPYPLMIWREDGRIMMVNAIFTEITGYALEDIPTYGEWTRKAFGERPLQQPPMVFYEELAGQDTKKWREFEITTRSGEKRTWDFSDAVLGTDPDDRWLMISMAVDITERKQIEEQLEENEEKFAAIFKKAPFAAALSKFPRAVFIDINEEFERLFDLSRQEIIGRTALDLKIRPNSRTRSKIMEGLRAHGSVRGIESILQTKSGRTRVLLLNVDLVTIGGDTYLLQTAEDITQRKQMEESLAEGERKYRELARSLELDRARLDTILKHLPVGVWISDSEGRLIGKNEQADRIWAGNAPLLETVEQYPQYQSWDPKTGLALEPEEYPLAVALRTGQPAEPVELKILRFDGSQGTVLVSAAPILDDHGTLTGVVAVNVDITDRKRAEEERRLAEQRYTALFNSVQEGFAHYTAVYDDQGKIVDLQVMEINPAGAKISGIAREDQIGRTWRQLWPDVSEQLFLQYQLADATGEILRFDDHNHITGRIYDVTIFNISRGEFIASFYDVTERKHAEEALRASEERFSKAFHKSPFAMNITRLQDGAILDVNDAWLNLLGWAREDVLGKTTADFPFYANAADRLMVRKRITKEEVSGDLEIHLVRRDGSELIAEVATTIIDLEGEQCILGVLDDITERKRAENALRQSEERFAKAFHSSPDAIIISRLSDGLIIEVNEGWHTIFEYRQSEVVGRRSLDLGVYVDPKDRERALALLQEKGSLRDYELKIRRKSGEIRQASMSVEKIEMNSVEYMLITMRDITERKQAEEHIAYQASLLARVNDAIVGSDAEYRLTAWNAAAESIYGWKAEEVLGKPGLEILQTEWQQEKAEEMRRKIAETGSWRGEATQLRKDGTRIPVEVSSMVLRDDQGQVTGYVSVNRDITERRIAEQALRESEKRFRSLADSMPQLVWTALPDGSVDYYNQRHEEYQSIRQKGGEDWDWAPVLHPDDSQATVDAWLHSVETGEIYQIEHRVRMKDGSYRWHLSRGVPMRDEKGRVLRWFGTATDIHDLKLAEQQLKVYANRLERSNRELEQFAFMASHDLQEPLRKIEMFGDLLLERARSLNESERNYVERMRSAAGRMRAMIEGLLQISRVATQGKPFVRVNLSKVIGEVLSDFESQIQRSGANVDLYILPVITGDPLQLRQLMQNLIGNALKYHQPGKPPEVKIFAHQVGEKVQIHVVDKGIGFDQEDADRIFEPFQRLVGRSQYEGSGIGLAICRRIVERHGGEIAAISERGIGTSFIITLPIHPPQGAKSEPRKDNYKDDDNAE
ncbi:MAG: PAS domain S-box protein [Syntrophothermus sp.]